MEIKVPYNFTPRGYQLPFLKAMDSGIDRAVIVWHRRSGKDKTVLNLTVKKMLERVGSYYYFFPTYSQGKKILWDGADKGGFKFLDHFPKNLLASKPNDTEMKVKLVNGSVFQIIGTDNIDSIVGTNPVGCVFSEYSLQNPKAWDFIRPILAENGGWAVFNFTPRGMNHGFNILQQAKDSDKWFWQVLTVDDTGVIPKDVLEEEKKQMPQALFEQEYYCKFLEGAGQFFRRITENVIDEEIQPEADNQYSLGVDLAKYQDWTVITPFCLNNFKVGKQERFNQVDWNLQKAKIEAFARKWNNSRVNIDSTGVGDPITEDLQRTGIPIEPFRFTETSRRQLLDNLALLLEQDKIKIPNDDGLIAELQSMKYELTERGKIKLQVPDAMTDDRIMSLALSVWGAISPIKTISKQSDFSLYKYNY